MSRVTESTDMTQAKPEELPAVIERFSQNVADALNGGLDFHTNFNGALVTANFTAANTDTAIAHNLGRIPAGYIKTSQGSALNIFDGVVKSTTKIIYLQSSAIGTAGLLIY